MNLNAIIGMPLVQKIMADLNRLPEVRMPEAAQKYRAGTKGSWYTDCGEVHPPLENH